MAERRERETGSIYELPGGRWRGEVQIRGERTRVYGGSKAEAERLLEQAISDLDAGRTRVAVKTINDVLDFYCHRMLDAGRTSSNRHAAQPTINLHRWAIDRVRDAVGTRRVQTFTTRDVDQLLADLGRFDGFPFSQRSAKQIKSTFNLAFAECIHAGVLLHNPVTNARLPAGLTPPRPRIVLDRRQISVMAKQALKDPRDARVAFCLLLGLRPGEVAALKWDVIRLEDRLIEIRRTRRDEKPEVVVDATKTPNSRRILSLHPLLQQYLRERRKQLLSDGLPPSPGDLVFSRNGNVMTRSNDVTTIARLCRTLGFEKMTMHDCRRSFATLQAEQGIDPYTLACTLGDTMETVYRHYVSRDATGGVAMFDPMVDDTGLDSLGENVLTYNG